MLIWNFEIFLSRFWLLGVIYGLKISFYLKELEFAWNTVLDVFVNRVAESWVCCVRLFEF